MHLTIHEISKLHRVRRLNLINGITGIKSANLIGTRSAKYGTNLSIFSSLVHLGSDPALVGFILRPAGKVERNTYENIKELSYYTINHVHESFAAQAHYTSAKFERGISEFDKCHLTEEYLNEFSAPYVKESKIKMGVKFEEEMFIKANGTTLIIGSIQELIVPDHSIDDKGYVRLDKVGDVGVGGLNSYYDIKRIKSFPYARVDELPNFELKEE